MDLISPEILMIAKRELYLKHLTVVDQRYSENSSKAANAFVAYMTEGPPPI